MPVAVKVNEKVEPLLRMPESKSPLGVLGTPEVALWLFATHVQVTVSPAEMVSVRGVKLFPLPTLTLKVAAVAGAPKTASSSKAKRAERAGGEAARRKAGTGKCIEDESKERGTGVLVYVVALAVTSP